MSLLNVNLNEAQDIELIPNGTETQVRVITLEVRTSKKDNEYLNIRLDTPEFENVDEIYDMVMLPGQGEDKKQTNRRLLQLRDLLAAFGVDIGDGNVDLQSLIDNQSLVGSTAFAILKIDSSGDRPRNQIARYVVPQS